MMLQGKDFLIVVIPPIITGLLGSGLITTIISDSGPKVMIGFFVSDRVQNRSTIEITNAGKSPVTGFSMLLESPNEIKEVSKGSESSPFVPIYVVQNNENFSLSEPVGINGSQLQIQIPELVQGTGSIISLDLSMNSLENLTTETVDLYAIYDQGSTRGYIFVSSFDLLGSVALLPQSLDFMYYTNFTGFLIFILLLIGFTAIYPFTILALLRRNRFLKNRPQERLRIETIVQLLSLRSVLNKRQQIDDNSIKGIFEYGNRFGNLAIKILFNDLNDSLDMLKTNLLFPDQKAEIYANSIKLIERILIEIDPSSHKGAKK